jgi:hypothetical protein
MTTSSLAHPAASATDDSSVNHRVRSEKLTKAVASAKATVQHKPAKKMRHRIPPSQRFRVMQKYALGTNRTAIARDENLNRESVGRIVKSAEMEAFTEEIRERWRGLCDAAVDSVRRLIAQDDRPTVLRVLESNGIIAPQGQVHNISVQTAPKSSGDERVKELMGAFAAVAIERARVYKTPFPEVQEVADKIGVKLGFELNGVSDDEAEEVEDHEI